MKPQDFSTLVNHIYATKENELPCSQVQELLPVYVEAEFEGNDRVASDIEIHLSYCPDCTQIYQGMRFLVEQEVTGKLVIEELLSHIPEPHHEPGILAPVGSSCD